MPGLWVQSSAGGRARGNPLMFLSHIKVYLPLFPPPFPSRINIRKFFLIYKKIIKQVITIHWIECFQSTLVSTNNVPWVAHGRLPSGGSLSWDFQEAVGTWGTAGWDGWARSLTLEAVWGNHRAVRTAVKDEGEVAMPEHNSTGSPARKLGIFSYRKLPCNPIGRH